MSQGKNKFIITRLPHLGNVLRFIVIVIRFILSHSLSLSVFFLCIMTICQCRWCPDSFIRIRISLRISRFILFTCCSSEAIKGAVLFIFLPKFLRFVSAAYRNALHCIVYREGSLLNIATFFLILLPIASVCTMKPMKSAMRFTDFSLPAVLFYLLFIILYTL